MLLSKALVSEIVMGMRVRKMLFFLLLLLFLRKGHIFWLKP